MVRNRTQAATKATMRMRSWGRRIRGVRHFLLRGGFTVLLPVVG